MGTSMEKSNTLSQKHVVIFVIIRTYWEIRMNQVLMSFLPFILGTSMECKVLGDISVEIFKKKYKLFL